MRKPVGTERLVVAGVGIVALLAIVIFGFYQWHQSAQLADQRAMVNEAGDELAQGAQSGLFTANGPADPGDITGFHPSYLLGAVAQLFNGKPDCVDSGHVQIIRFQASCILQPGISLSVQSDMMPELLGTQRMTANNFNSEGRPHYPNGRVANEPDSTFTLRFASIYYSDIPQRFGIVADAILYGLTRQHLNSIMPNGSWFPARIGLGFRSCKAIGTRGTMVITCYQNS